MITFDDKEISMYDSLYEDACALVIIQMVNFNRFQMNFEKSMMALTGNS